jgi:hypothetical protein
MSARRASAAALLLAWLLFANPASAEAAIVRGLQQVISGVFQVPISILVGTFSGPPVVGTVFGAVNGLVSGVGLVASGTLELAASGVSIAKMVAPYVLPFLL